MPSHNPYEYTPADTPRIINWPKIILWGLGILILAFIIVFFIMDPLSLIKEKADGLLNNSLNNSEVVNEGAVCITESGTNYCVCSGDFYNCNNFTRQIDAQVAYDWCIEQSKGDI